MPSKKISLYECLNAKVGKDIYCSKGHKLGDRGTVTILQWKRGEPLVYEICQKCHDFNRMGEPILPEDRGWV